MSKRFAGILEVEGLGFGYEGQAPLIADWSITIAGGVTRLHGDIGSGKSTLLRCLSGDLPSTGRLSLVGVRLDQHREAYRLKLFLNDPDSVAHDRMTARACAAALHGGAAGVDANEWQCLVDGFALARHLDKPLYMLSTGTKRKVWLAAALASRRALILLDEPGAALDAASVRCLHAALSRRARRPDVAVIVAAAEPLDGILLAAEVGLPLR